MKSFSAYISEAPKVTLSPATEKIKQQKKVREALAVEIRKNPLTLCKILSEKTPKTFIDTIKSSPDDAINKWIKKLLGNRTPKHDEMHRLFASVYPSHEKLYKVFEGLTEWFETTGGSKRGMSAGIMSILACKDRAPWASWKGTAYRGLQRSLARVSKYSYTGEIEKFNFLGRPLEFLVGTAKYKSKYPLQSWSDSWATAWDFASGRYSSSPATGEYAVILETTLTREETVLSPGVIREISRFGDSESEVIRFRNTPETVKVYVNTVAILDGMDTMLPTKSETEKTFIDRMVKTHLVPVVGEKAAKKIMSGKSGFVTHIREHAKMARKVP